MGTELVQLVSGGLDSTLMASMAKDRGLCCESVFIDYGQRAMEREWAACMAAAHEFELPVPRRCSVAGYGELIASGLTDSKKDVFLDAFTPGRNLMFLLIGSAYAYQRGARSVSIGFLHESTAIFPDQTNEFIGHAERLIGHSLDTQIAVIAPLRFMSKKEVIELAEKRGIHGTYSCHVGNPTPCGVCIACREFLVTEAD